MRSIISVIVALGVLSWHANAEAQETAVWQTNKNIIIQSQNGCTSIPSPGAYNSYPDYMILSADGRHLALPVRSDQGMSLYVIDLITRDVTDLGRFRQADLPRISSDGRYVEVLTESGFELCDVATRRWRPLGKGLASVSWAPRADLLFYSDAQGGVFAYDALSSSSIQPDPKLIDEAMGGAYRSSVRVRQRLPTTQVSPSRRWAFVGPLEGGIIPWEINGQYYDGIGERMPYRYGFMDGHWNLKTFSAPMAYDTDEFYPIAWTASEDLVMVNPELKDRILIVDPATGRSRFQVLKPPVKGAVLIAMRCFRRQTISRKAYRQGF